MIPETHTILITPEERSVILKHLDLPAGIVARFRFALHQAEFLEVSMAESDLGLFLEHLMSTMAESDDPAFKEAVMALTERNAPEEEGPLVFDLRREYFPDDMPDELFEELRDFFQDREFESEEAAMAAMQEFIESQSSQSLGVCGGLSPEQLYALLCTRWDDTDTAVTFATDLTPEDVAGSAMVRNGQLLLQAIADAGSVRLTKTGNMNRKFLHAVARETRWPGGEEEEFFTYSKQPNETDLIPVHFLRVLLDQAGLLKKRKGVLTLTKKGEAAMRPDAAGELQVALFRTMCRKFNLAYLDRIPEYHGIQQSYAAILYFLQQLASEEFVDVDDLAEQVFLQEVLEEMASYGFQSHASFALVSRLLHPLRFFGLVELLRGKHPKYNFECLCAARTTPLFQKMIRFNLPEAIP